MISTVPVSEELYDVLAFVSVVKVRDVSRWKVQIGSHHSAVGMFFTDCVFLREASLYFDQQLLQKKINHPESGHMFGFAMGKLARPPATYDPGRRINIATREPKTIDDAYFVFLDDGSKVGQFDFFYGDNNGFAWVS